jgi:apolipoprotein N-acyltransferase
MRIRFLLESQSRMNDEVPQTEPSQFTGQAPLPAEASTSQAVAATQGLPIMSVLLWAAGAVACFQLGYSSPALSWLLLGYAFSTFQITRAKSTRQSFYVGLAVGVLIAAFQLDCFWVIFGPGAIALWLVLAFWIGLFAALSRLCIARFGPRWGLVLVPFIWTGLEYFRSEL